MSVSRRPVNAIIPTCAHLDTADTSRSNGGPLPRSPSATWSPLLQVALGHLAFVATKCRQDLALLALGDHEVVKRSPKLSRDLIEDRWRDLQVAMGFFEAEISAARLRGRIDLWPAGDGAHPQRAHELEARKSVQLLGAPLVQLRVVRSLTGDRVAHNGVAEVVNHCRDSECAAQPFVQTRLGHLFPLKGSGGSATGARSLAVLSCPRFHQCPPMSMLSLLTPAVHGWSARTFVGTMPALLGPLRRARMIDDHRGRGGRDGMARLRGRRS